MSGNEEVRVDQHMFRLDDSQWQAFQDVLDRPVRSKPHLAKLFADQRLSCLSPSGDTAILSANDDNRTTIGQRMSDDIVKVLRDLCDNNYNDNFEKVLNDLLDYYDHDNTGVVKALDSIDKSISLEGLDAMEAAIEEIQNLRAEVKQLKGDLSVANLRIEAKEKYNAKKE